MVVNMQVSALLGDLADANAAGHRSGVGLALSALQQKVAEQLNQLTGSTS